MRKKKEKIKEQQAIVISLKSARVEDILNGDETHIINIRRPNKDKLHFPLDVYIHCTNRGERNIELPWTPHAPKQHKGRGNGNNMVVAKFTLNEVTPVYIDDLKDVVNKTRMRYFEIYKYLNIDYFNTAPDQILGWLWKIDDLIVFENPRPLQDFGLLTTPQMWTIIKKYQGENIYIC